LKPIMETVPAGFASIYLPYIWIPASAGMTKTSNVSRDLSGLASE